MNQNGNGIESVVDGVMMEQRPTIKAIQNSKGEYHFEIKGIAKSSSFHDMNELAEDIAVLALGLEGKFIGKGLKVAS